MPTEKIYENISWKDSPFYRGDNWLDYLVRGKFLEEKEIDNELQFWVWTLKQTDNAHVLDNIDKSILSNTEFAIPASAVRKTPYPKTGDYSTDARYNMVWEQSATQYQVTFKLARFSDTQDTPYFKSILNFIFSVTGLDLLGVSLDRLYNFYVWIPEKLKTDTVKFDKNVLERNDQKSSENSNTKNKSLFPFILGGLGIVTGNPLLFIGSAAFLIFSKNDDNSDKTDSVTIKQLTEKKAGRV